jgi:mannose-6-phosphate isomerase-like protein (cupin superfamily)/predicted transcriptional regulator
MSNVGKYLVEELIKEIENITDYVVVYSGRFQPFHKGHNITYQHLVKKFGKDNVYIGTSDKTDKLKSPFNFKEKKTIMMKMFGIPSNRIIQIKNPYAPIEILKKFDDDTTAFVTVVGEKDEQRLGGKYFTPYKGEFDAGYRDKGYVYISPAQPNAISGTDVRNWLGKGNTEDRKKLFAKAYPKFDEKIFQLITTKLSSLNEQIFIPKEFIEQWVAANLTKVIREITTSTTGPAANAEKNVDDGPNFFFPNYDTFDAISKSRAEQIGYTVFRQIMSGELEDYYEHPIYPDGPVKAVTPFPAGVIGKTTATNQKDFGGEEAYSKWFNHVTRSMGLVGYQLVKDMEEITKELAIDGADSLKPKEANSLSLDEDITIPVKIGDTILTGKFKNKKVIVTSIGKDDRGMPTVNGKKVVNFRLMAEGLYIEMVGDEVECSNCNHSWKIDVADKNPYLCHKCGWNVENNKFDYKGLAKWKQRMKSVDEMYKDSIDELIKEFKSEGLLSEIPMGDLQQIDTYADKQMNPVDVVLTGKHFIDRLIDIRNKKPISAAELIGFFKRLARRKNEFVSFLKQYGEIVAKDNRTKINIPFMKQANKAIAKTIMRKDDFKTPSPELKFESSGKGNMYDPKRIKAYYEALCKAEGIKPLPLKFKAVGMSGAATTYDTRTMKPLYISFDVNRLTDPEFAIIHELTHQIKLETEGDAYLGKRDKLVKFIKLENYLIDKYVYTNYSKILYENKNNEDWAIFRLNNGKKWYVTSYNPMMKRPDEYKSNVKYSSSEVLKFTHDKAIKIIQNDIGIDEKYGIVNNKGIQKKFDWRVKYPKKYEDVASLISETTDYGKSPYVFDLEDATEDNEYFRKTIWTGDEMQMTLMSVDDEIGLEVHNDGDQFIRVEDGNGKVIMGKTADNLNFDQDIEGDYGIFIPAGYYHNIINTSDKPLKLYAIYSPVEHPAGKVDVKNPIEISESVKKSDYINALKDLRKNVSDNAGSFKGTNGGYIAKLYYEKALKIGTDNKFVDNLLRKRINTYNKKEFSLSGSPLHTAIVGGIDLILQNLNECVDKYINEDTVKHISKSLGVARKDMPQINSKDVGEFVNYLKDKGISVTSSKINVSNVGMTQKDINVDKVKGLLGASINHLHKPVIISKDGYILDGHHRVAALYNIDKNYKISTIKVGVGIKDLLNISKSFPKVSYKSITESNITGMGSGNNSSRWTPSGKAKKLEIEQLSGYIQTDFPVADSVDISKEKHGSISVSKNAKYNNKVRAARDASGNLVFEGMIQEGRDYIVCNACGEHMKQIQYRHLKYNHNMTLDEYKIKYPNSKLVCESAKNIGDKNPMKNADVKAKHATITKSDAYRKKMSETMTGKNIGNKRPDLIEKNKNEEFRKKISDGVKNSYKNNVDLKLKRAEIGKKYGFGNKNTIEKLYESGRWTRPENRDKFELYTQYVRAESGLNYQKFFKHIPNAKKRSRDFHLDHKYSIKEAFDNNIPIEVVSHYKNLEIIGGRLNESKGKNSSISLNELINDIQNSIKPIDNRTLLLCGGTYGHMHHPFDVDINLTFGQLKDIVKKALTGQLEMTREKCIAGDTIIHTEKNGNMTIAEYVDNGVVDKVLSFNEDTGKNEYMDVMASFNNDTTDEWLEIELEDGKTIQVTPNHRMYVEGIGYVEAKDLTEDMELKIV